MLHRSSVRSNLQFLRSLFFIHLFLLAATTGEASSVDSLKQDLSIRQKSGEGLAKAYLEVGNAYIRLDSLENAIQYLQEGSRLAAENGDDSTWLEALGNQGYAHDIRGESEQAILIFMKGLRAADSLQLKKSQAKFLFLIGDYFRFQHHPESAIEYLTKAGALYKELGMSRAYCRNYLYPLGGTYKVIGSKESDLKAVKIYEELLAGDCTQYFDAEALAKTYDDLGGVYIYLKEYKTAEKHLLKAMEYAQKSGKPNTEASVLSELGALLYKQQLHQKANEYAKAAYELAKDGENVHLTYEILNTLANINRELGNYKEAIEYMSWNNGLRDSVENKERVQQVAELELKYQTAQKEQEIERQELELAVQQYKFQSLMGFGALLLALAIGVFFWYQYRLKLKEQEALVLADLDRAKTLYFTNISHELRTPLSLIIDPLNHLHKKVKQPEQKALIQTASSNANRMLGLVNQMLDLSKLEAGKLPLRAQPAFIDNNVSSIVELFRATANQRGIELTFSTAEDQLEVYFDSDKLEKIISNLLTNALKFTKKGGRIQVVMYQKNEQVSIVIKDTGTGIPEEKLPFIFERFYQVDDSQTRQFEGTGIGLALVKELVELHYGQIAAESREGHGTTMTVRLPLGRNHLRADEIQAGKVIPAKAKKQTLHRIGKNQISKNTPITSPNKLSTATNKQGILLIVEDHQELRQYIVRQMQEHYSILEAVNGQEGLEMAVEHIPDLIISDVMMPLMDGYELCKHLKNDPRSAHIPIILLTAKSSREEKLTGLRQQADDYLSKPFDSEELRIRTSNLIEQRNQLRQKYSQARSISPKDITVNSVDENFLTNLLEVIETNMANEQFGVEALSKAIGMSRSQLHRKLKALVDQNTSQFLRSIRLKRAYQLLEQSAGSASEIAYQVGFRNSNYFFKCFKDEFSITPGQVLKEKQSPEISN